MRALSDGLLAVSAMLALASAGFRYWGVVPEQPRARKAGRPAVEGEASFPRWRTRLDQRFVGIVPEERIGEIWSECASIPPSELIARHAAQREIFEIERQILEETSVSVDAGIKIAQVHIAAGVVDLEAAEKEARNAGIWPAFIDRRVRGREAGCQRDAGPTSWVQRQR